MAVNFGTLDYFGHCPAEELKNKIRVIAYEGIRDMLAGCSDDTPEDCKAQISGIIYTTENFCGQIDAEVADTRYEYNLAAEKAEAIKNDKIT